MYVCMYSWDKLCTIKLKRLIIKIHGKFGRFIKNVLIIFSEQTIINIDEIIKYLMGEMHWK